jgi:hypothetical protein
LAEGEEAAGGDNAAAAAAGAGVGVTAALAGAVRRGGEGEAEAEETDGEEVNEGGKAAAGSRGVGPVSAADGPLAAAAVVRGHRMFLRAARNPS